MNVELSEHLPLLASAPDGIQKLRGLILGLAVRGKLVPQDPNDEPADALLLQIAQERARLAGAKTRKTDDRNSVGNRAPLFQLPESWVWVGFGEIVLHNAGKTLDRGRNSGQPRDYITTSNLYWGRFELGELKQMLIDDDEMERCTAKKNDLLICEGGEAGRAAVWPYDRVVCFQNHVHRARFFGGIDPYFGYYFFEWLNASGEIDQYRKGVGISNMSGKALASIPFTLPPLAEQHRIVAKVDELMGLCDRLEAEQADAECAQAKLVETLLGTLTQSSDAADFTVNWQRLAEHFDTLFTTESSLEALKQTILQLAVMGKLVSQDPSDESGTELLRRIRFERASASVLARSKVNKSSVINISQTLPSNWEWAQLVDLAEAGPSNGYSPKPCPHETGFRCLTLSATTKGYFKPDCFKYVDITEDTAERFFLKQGDLLIQRGNSIEYVGMAALYDHPDDEFIYPDLMMRIRLTKHCDERFIHTWLISKDARKYFMKSATGTQGTMPKVNQGIVSNTPVPVPPLAEQHRIVAKVDELITLCNGLKAALAKSRSHQDRLASALTESALKAA